MKNSFYLVLLILIWSPVSFSQECYPDENGHYMYYVNMNQEKVPDSFNKDDLLKLIGNQQGDKESIKFLEKNISSASKSFPTSKTEFLQRSVTVYSKRNDLSKQLSTFKKLFNLVEFICEPKEKLLYEPNDFELNNDTHASAHLKLIKATGAWDYSVGDSRILIGILDTYLKTDHNDLQHKISQVVTNYGANGIYAYHGTAVAGCAAADTDNGTGIASSGGHSNFVFSSQMGNDNAVLLMSQMPGVRVINMSWINTCSYSSTQEQLYQTILDIENVVLVGGAGNNNDHCGSNNYVYPASHPSVLSVSSVGHLSNRGYVDPIYGANNWKDVHPQAINNPASTHHHNDRVALCAPGYNVKTTNINGSYGGVWGTSFASPQVAGVCALVAGINPCLTATEIRDIVTSTADPYIYALPENAPFIGLLGSGRLDAEQAAKKAIDLGTEFVQNKYYTGTQVETAETDLLSGYNITNTIPFGLITIESGSDITFRATHKIVLGEGLIIKNQSTFKAEIYDSPCF
ncbi:MAG: S8/S53 family peptidase [Crocinitomicaceae bacterium]|nr:S8/S53 family peptidase [Crocinitomicaceae bacterium]